MQNKKGQIWIETVIYTLIALLLIGAVLAFITPKIQEIQDKAIIDQSIEILKNIDGIITSIVGVSGNKRIVEVKIRKGSLIINSDSDKIMFEIDSEHAYSQEGESINIGGVIVLTEKKGSSNKVTLTIDQSKYNLTYNGKEELETITQAPIPYKLSIENRGGSKTNINFELN